MSEQVVKIGMIGCGTVGRGVAELLREHGDLYAERFGKRIEIGRVLVRDLAKAQAAGCVDAALLTDDAEAFFDTPDLPIIVEVAGGIDPIDRYVQRALSTGRHVVTANKALLARKGSELFALARQHEAAIAFEASCAGAIPCVTALQLGLMANKIDGLYGILNGTCNYILSEMTRRGRTYADALAEAQTLGYAEADPTLDVSGADAGQKLAILASLAFGMRIAETDVTLQGIEHLELDDLRFGAELGYDVKLLAIAERRNGQVAVGVQPCFVSADSLIARVGGSHNALAVRGNAAGTTIYYGAGAGQMPTASAVVSDLLNVAAGWYPQAFAQIKTTPDCYQPATLMPPSEVIARFYLRVNALDTPGVMAEITRILGEHHISLSAVLQHEVAVGQFVPVVITTHNAAQADVDKAAKRIRQLDVIDGEPVVLRVVEFDQ